MSHVEYALLRLEKDVIDGRTDGRQTVTLRGHSNIKLTTAAV